MRYFSNRDDAVKWAKHVLDNRYDYVILDTETTGLDDDDEVIQIAVIDLVDQTPLVELGIKPNHKRHFSSASAIHGIYYQDLKLNQPIQNVIQDVFSAIQGKTVLIYNAKFDTRLINQSLQIAGLNGQSVERYAKNVECVMEAYAAFVGEWHYGKGGYKWQKLPNGDHTAWGDCFATLNVIRKMAFSDLSEEAQNRAMLEELENADPVKRLRKLKASLRKSAQEDQAMIDRAMARKKEKREERRKQSQSPQPKPVEIVNKAATPPKPRQYSKEEVRKLLKQDGSSGPWLIFAMVAIFIVLVVLIVMNA